MIWADNRRPWRLIQRDFLKLEAARAQYRADRVQVDALRRRIGELQKRKEQLAQARTCDPASRPPNRTTARPGRQAQLAARYDEGQAEPTTQSA